MTNEKARKIATVKSVETLAPGVSFELCDWHVATTKPDGSMVLVNMDLKMPDEEEDARYYIRPGSYRVTPKNGLQSIKFSDSVYHETETSVRLRKLFNTFKSNLHVYEELGITNKKRGILLGSAPGVGKSSLINNFCKALSTEEKACVLFIDSEEVNYETIISMFRKANTEDTSFIVVVIEDIGGGDLNDRRHSVDSTMLNFLDGQEGMFSIPTLIVATTNHLDLLANSLTSRPGRFDFVEEVMPPGDEESFKFVEDFIKRPMNDSEKSVIRGKKFTPAYLRECVIRHRLDSISFEEAVEQLTKQRTLSEGKRRQAGGSRTMGLGGIFDDE
jgi:SpoVK/Ycf46/Vps4 family AAA+-type ATPase